MTRSRDWEIWFKLWLCGFSKLVRSRFWWLILVGLSTRSSGRRFLSSKNNILLSQSPLSWLPAGEKNDVSAHSSSTTSTLMFHVWVVKVRPGADRQCSVFPSGDRSIDRKCTTEISSWRSRISLRPGTDGRLIRMEKNPTRAALRQWMAFVVIRGSWICEIRSCIFRGSINDVLEGWQSFQ